VSVAGSRVDHARTETYLRLRAEAELRRVLQLPSDVDDMEAGNEGEPAQLTAGEGLRRFSVVAHALIQAGTIHENAADSVTEQLTATMFARSWLSPSDLEEAYLLAPRRDSQLTHAPAGQYFAVPVRATVPGGPGSDLAEIQVFSLVIAPDRALLNAAGRLRKPLRRRRPEHSQLPFEGSALPTATDDRGNSYHLTADSSSADSSGDWTCLLSLSPIPQPGLRWLELTMSPGSPPVRVDMASHRTGSEQTAAPVAATSPAERIVDVAAQRLLHAAVSNPDDDVSWYDLSEIADIISALHAAGLLQAANGSVGRLVTLARRAGARIPPALDAAQPAGLPAAWQNILENRGRDDGPFAFAPAAAVLPELGGTRFALAGVRSGAGGAELRALAWGLPQPPRFSFFTDAAKQWSWTARDDKGRWHVAAEGGGSSDDRHAEIELQFVPALHPDATSLEVTVTGPSGQVSATVPLDWWECP
jgi:hypothetical protein